MADFDREKHARDLARGCLKSYLDGKKNLEWATSMIKIGTLYGMQSLDLENVFRELEGRGNQERFKEAQKRCQEEGWL